MKKLFCTLPLLLVAVFSLLLTSCGPIYSTTYTYVPPKTKHGQRCANRCLEQKSTCTTNCNMVHQACRMEADAVAQPAYQDYLRAQRKAGQAPVRRLSDFADYGNCGGDCGCGDTYNQCFTNCGGKIIPHTVCTAFCDKAEPGTVKK